MSKETGGPAFPTEAVQIGELGLSREDGMTLRDWFAGQALIGMLSNPNIETHPDAGAYGLAKFSYFQADAMLAERSKP